MPSSPSLQAWAKTFGPSPSICSLNRMPGLALASTLAHDAPGKQRYGKSRPPVRVPDGRGAYCVFNEGAVQPRDPPFGRGFANDVPWFRRKDYKHIRLAAEIGILFT